MSVSIAREKGAEFCSVLVVLSRSQEAFALEFGYVFIEVPSR